MGTPRWSKAIPLLGSLNHNGLVLRLNRQFAESLPYSGRVVDLGCGSSPYKKIILDRAKEYVGVDWGHSLHDNKHVDVVADLSQPLPLPDGYADTVTSFQVIEHLPEPTLFLSECNRILQPGGSLFLTTPFMWHVHEAPFDYFRYTRHGLTHALKKAGFSDIIINETSGFWQMLAMKINYHTARWPRIVRIAMVPLWWLGQAISPALDKIDPHPEETFGYTVIARKP